MIIPDTGKEVDEEANNVQELCQIGQPHWQGSIDEWHTRLRSSQRHHKQLLQQAHQSQQPAFQHKRFYVFVHHMNKSQAETCRFWDVLLRLHTLQPHKSSQLQKPMTVALDIAV